MLEKERLVKIIETERAIVGLRDDGIYHVYYKPNTEITVELQAEMHEVFKEITSGKPGYFIFEAGEYVSVTSEARVNAVKTEDDSFTCATVVYVNSLAYKLIAEFYYKFNKPKQPYKVASDFNKGILWLLNLRKEVEEREIQLH